jgi:hypothetical protein
LAGQGIYFLDPGAPAGPIIQFFDFASQQTTSIAQLGTSEEIGDCQASPDGQWFLYTAWSYPRGIMLVENFR